MNRITASHITKEETYVPETGIKYPDTPDTPLLTPKKLRTVVCDENYPYLDRSIKARLWSNIEYLIIFCLVFPLNRLRYGFKVTGRKNLRKNKGLLKNGAITVCNHVFRWDYISVLQAVRYRKMWFPARAANLEGSDAAIIRGSGGIPISETLGGMKKFNAAFDQLHKEKKWIHVFPEACRWDWYQPIRPFKKGAFVFAFRYNIPVIPMAISYREPKGFRKLFGCKHPLITVNIGEPIMPDLSLGRKEACIQLRDQAFNQMVKLAGIEQNMWESEGD